MLILIRGKKTSKIIIKLHIVIKDFENKLGNVIKEIKNQIKQPNKLKMILEKREKLSGLPGRYGSTLENVVGVNGYKDFNIDMINNQLRYILQD